MLILAAPRSPSAPRAFSAQAIFPPSHLHSSGKPLVVTPLWDNMFRATRNITCVSGQSVTRGANWEHRLGGHCCLQRDGRWGWMEGGDHEQGLQFPLPTQQSVTFTALRTNGVKTNQPKSILKAKGRGVTPAAAHPQASALLLLEQPHCHKTFVPEPCGGTVLESRWHGFFFFFLLKSKPFWNTKSYRSCKCQI